MPVPESPLATGNFSRSCVAARLGLPGPDTVHPAMTAPRPLPLDLPRLVMRRALAVAAAALTIAVVLGFSRAGTDIEEEMQAAHALAQTMAGLSAIERLDETQALDALGRLQHRAALRHLALSVRNGQGQVLLAPAEVTAARPPVSWLIHWQERLFQDVALAPVSWPLARADGPAWTVTLSPSRASERREAMADLAGLLGVLVAGVATMLAVMAWQLHRAFQPLQALLAVIGRVEHGDPLAVRSLPPMPIRELQAVASAVRRLGEALETAQAEQRLLGQKVLTLQEDERHRLAAELHDEFGQRLTAVRVDATWLRHRLQGQDELLHVVEGIVTQCERIHADIRSLLSRLQPLGPGGASEDDAPDGLATERVDRLVPLLQSLVDGWRREGGPAMRLIIESPMPAADLGLPRAVALALYRISQEGLTNVARHAQASEATLSLRFETIRREAPHDASEVVTIDWRLSDDGIGLTDTAAAMRRGNGLAGIKERVWALGGDLSVAPRQQGHARPGLCLQARLSARAAAADVDARALAPEHVA